MDEGALAGTRVLVVGGPREAAETMRAQLSAAGSPSVDLVPVLDLVAVQAAAAHPEVVLALPDTSPEAVRGRLDPLGLDAGPPVVPVDELTANGQPLGAAGVRRLALVLEHRAMRRRLGELEAIVASQALSAFRDTEAIRVDALHRLALAAEYRDDNSPEHTQRVGALAARMARHMGQEDRVVSLVRQAAPLHDLGKIAIPDSILLKPGKLDEDERATMQQHPEISSYIVGELDLPDIVKQMVRAHHERWDGGGYPDGLEGTDIPLGARVFAIADALDAMTTTRPYRRAGSWAAAAQEILAQKGTQFDPAVVKVFAECETELRRVAHELVPV